MSGCRHCEQPIPTGNLVLCEVTKCPSKPTAWHHDKNGLHWLVCEQHRG